MKMPEAVAYYSDDWKIVVESSSKIFWPDAKNPLYDKQALIDLLEEAAMECEATHKKRTKEGMKTGFNAIMECAEAIRSMKETL